MMLRAWMILIFLALAGPSTATEVQTITVDGRPFTLYAPDGAGQAALPLVVVLHGASGNGDRMAEMFPLYDEQGAQAFRVAYLSATMFRTNAGKASRQWNDGTCCGDNLRPDADDSGYVADVIATLTAQGLAEPGKTALVGYSNGAKMAYRVACEHGDLLQTMVAIAGGLVEYACVNLTGLRVLNIDGSEDTRAPLEGGASPQRREIINDPIADAGASLVDQGASFRLMVVQGAGHELPSLNRALRASTGQNLVKTVEGFLFP